MSVGFKKGFLKAAEQFLVFVLQNITEHILCLSIPHVPPFLLLFPPFTWCQWICMRACWAHRGMWHPPRCAAAPARSTCAWTEACNNKICAWTLQQQNMCLNTATTKHVLQQKPATTKPMWKQQWYLAKTLEHWVEYMLCTLGNCKNCVPVFLCINLQSSFQQPRTQMIFVT